MSRGNYFGPADSVNSTASVRARRDALDRVFAAGFPYSRKLEGHKSCVNALTFSSGDGRWLASAGDDLRVQLWDFHQEDIHSPSCSFFGPRANVIAVAFSASNRYIFSGGADSIVFKYDMSLAAIDAANPRYYCDQYRQHSDMVRGIAPHPYQDEVFLSASDDGSILLHDGRAKNRMTRAQSTLQNNTEFTDVRSHPFVEHLFATSDSHGKVCLRDSRMAFGPLVNRTREGIVRIYNTKLSKRGSNYLSNPEPSSITFDRQGTRLGVTMLHFKPTIYSVSDPHPIAICSGRYRQDGSPVPPGERSYSNSCTMKHGSFGGPGLATDEYFSAGSDDFRGYVWKLPDTAQMIECRQKVSANDWGADSLSDTGFSEGQRAPRYVPMELSIPTFRLNGHQSIVNNTLIHPSFLHILTSGVERHIILHATVESSPCALNMVRTDTNVRNVPDTTPEDRERFIRALHGSHPIPDEESEESGDEVDTISFFDQILRHEADSDVFALRRWKRDSDSDSNSESDSDSDSDTNDVQMSE